MRTSLAIFSTFLHFLVFSAFGGDRLYRPQEPVRPYPYHEEEVCFRNEHERIRLYGTLTLPKGKGPFPAVVLIHGAGPYDRDEPLYTHKTFLVLADYLTRQGIAVLRYDKRGIGKSEGNYTLATSKDLAEDAGYAFEYLKTRREINIHQTGLIGHSEGGLIAPMVVAKSKDVAFLISLAGPGVNGEEIWCEQGVLLQRTASVPEECIELDCQLRRKIATIIKNEPDRNKAEKELHAAVNEFISVSPQQQREWLQLHSVASKIATFNTPWFHHFFSYDPASMWQHAHLPILIVFGGQDLIVSPKQNIPPIVKVLEESGNINYTIIKTPKINHIFQTCRVGTREEMPQIEETIAPNVLNIISNWIDAVTR